MKSKLNNHAIINLAKSFCLLNYLKTIIPHSRFFWLFIIMTAFTTGESIAQVIGPGTAPVYPPAGGFAIDGNLEANVTSGGIGDWVPGAGTGGSVLLSNGTPVNSGSTYHSIDLWGVATDEKFAGGDKGTDDPNTWGWVTANATNKLDINNALVHITTDTTTGEVWAILSSDRYANTGDTYVDFEFYQDSLYTTSTGGWVSEASPTTGGRTIGDFLFTVHYKNANPEFYVYRWEYQSTKPVGYTYVLYTTLPAGSIYAATNTASIPVPYPAFGLTTYPLTTTFLECSVNLSQVLGTINACTDLRITTILIKAKASESPTADLDDFVAPIQVNNLSFGNAEAGLPQSKCNEGGSYTVFTMAGEAVPSPGYTVQSTTWSVVSYIPSGGTAPHIVNASSLTSDAWVYGTSATLKLTVVTIKGSNTCTVDDEVVLTVYPSVNFGTLTSGDQTFCNPGGDPSNITFATAPSGGSGTFTYQWYYQAGLPSCPSGTDPSGWILISGATSNSYDPPAVTASTTYAVMVDATGTPDCGVPTWATGCRKITVLPSLNFGTLTSGDELICNGGDPSNIAFSISPSGGAGTFTYQWYYQAGIISCPSGTDNSGWTSMGGATGSSYDPPSGLAASRTYAVMVDATGSPDCGVATWASGCRQVTVYNDVTCIVTADHSA